MARGHRRVELAGAVLELTAESAELERYLDWHFGRLPDTALPVDLRIRLGPGPLPAPVGTPSMLDGPITRWDDGRVLDLQHEHGARARLVDEELLLAVGELPRSEWREVRQLLFSALSWFLERRGLTVLHAALVGRDGEALLLLGASGGGKSTAAVAGLLAGWELLSDDLVVVAERGGGPEVFGIPKRASVDRSIAGSFGTVLPPLPDDPRDRVMLPESTFALGWRWVRALVTVGHSSADGDVRALGHAEALAGLVTAFLEAERPEALRRHLHVLALLAGRPHFALAHAADPDRRAHRAAEMLDEIWSAPPGGAQ